MSREECEYNKTMMIAIAKDRDAGMTEKQEVHQIVTQFTNAGFKQGLPGSEIVKTIDFWKGMTHMVYIHPQMTPEQMGQAAEATCSNP